MIKKLRAVAASVPDNPVTVFQGKMPFPTWKGYYARKESGQGVIILDYKLSRRDTFYVFVHELGHAMQPQGCFEIGGYESKAKNDKPRNHPDRLSIEASAGNIEAGILKLVYKKGYAMGLDVENIDNLVNLLVMVFVK